MIGAVAVIASLAVSAQWSALAVAGALTLPAVAGYMIGRGTARWLSTDRQRRAVLVAVLGGAALALARAAG